MQILVEELISGANTAFAMYPGLAFGASEVIETFGTIVRKSGRVLSSANETHIREAAQRLNTVLSSLPQIPATDDGQPVADFDVVTRNQDGDTVLSGTATARLDP